MMLKINLNINAMLRGWDLVNHFGRSGSGSGSGSGLGSKPGHDRSGRRGYLGKLGWVSCKAQCQKLEPRREVTTRL
jgi:hypothetical protein